MFAPMILPFQLTCLLLVGLFFGLKYRLGKRMKSPGFMAFVICLVSFVPCLFVVSEIVGFVRYGESSYSQKSQIDDDRIDLPPDAGEIELHKYVSGHAVKFHSSPESLDEWMYQLTESRQKRTDATPFHRVDEKRELATEEFKQTFAEYEWSCPADVIVYRGWHSASGAGFDVWYSPSSETAYIRATYW